VLFQSANATAATVQTDKKKAAKAGSKHKVEATADDTEGTSKAVEEPAPESKRASEPADYGASQLHEFSQVIPLIYLCLVLTTFTVTDVTTCLLSPILLWFSTFGYICQFVSHTCLFGCLAHIGPDSIANRNLVFVLG